MVIFEFMKSVIITVIYTLSGFIDIIPELLKLKNAPIDGLALAFGVPTVIVIIILYIIKKIYIKNKEM